MIFSSTFILESWRCNIIEIGMSHQRESQCESPLIFLGYDIRGDLGNRLIQSQGLGNT